MTLPPFSRRNRERRLEYGHPWPLFFVFLALGSPLAASSSSTGPQSSSTSRRPLFSWPGQRGFPLDDDDPGEFLGIGRELNLFETQGSQVIRKIREVSSRDDDQDPFEDDLLEDDSQKNDVRNQRRRNSDPSKRISSGRIFYSSPRSSRSTGGRGAWSSQQQRQRQQYQSQRQSSFPNSSFQTRTESFLAPVRDWWMTNISPNIKNWPKIQCRVEPTTTLKIRKTFRPLKTIVRLGADFNTQLGVWQFKSSWEDEIIGGKLTLAGRELQLTKSWPLSVGVVDDVITRLRFRAAVDLQTWKAYARVGFRTERLSPINVMEGFTLLKQIPLDGSRGNVKLEVKANFALPEPEIEYSTETHRSLIGMGDIEVNIEELNLVLDY